MSIFCSLFNFWTSIDQEYFIWTLAFLDKDALDILITGQVKTNEQPYSNMHLWKINYPMWKTPWQLMLFWSANLVKLGSSTVTFCWPIITLRGEAKPSEISKASQALQLWDWHHPDKALLPLAECFFSIVNSVSVHSGLGWLNLIHISKTVRKRGKRLYVQMKSLRSFRIVIPSGKAASPPFDNPDDPAPASPSPMTCAFPMFLNCVYLPLHTFLTIPYVTFGDTVVLHCSSCYHSELFILGW